MRGRLVELGILVVLAGAVVHFGGKLGAEKPSNESSPVPLVVTASPSSLAVGEVSELEVSPPQSTGRKFSALGSDDEDADPAQDYPKMLQDWRSITIDGIHMDMDAGQILAASGRPAKEGSIYFVNRRYRRWTWPDDRQVIHFTMDGEKKARLDYIRGYSLAVGGETYLQRGDSEEQAKAFIGNEQLQLSWGRGLKIDYRFALTVEIEDGLVSSFTFAVPVGRPMVPVEGEGEPVSGD